MQTTLSWFVVWSGFRGCNATACGAAYSLIIGRTTTVRRTYCTRKPTSRRTHALHGRQRCFSSSQINLSFSFYIVFKENNFYFYIPVVSRNDFANNDSLMPVLYFTNVSTFYAEKCRFANCSIDLHYRNHVFVRSAVRIYQVSFLGHSACRNFCFMNVFCKNFYGSSRCRKTKASDFRFGSRFSYWIISAGRLALVPLDSLPVMHPLSTRSSPPAPRQCKLVHL